MAIAALVEGAPAGRAPMGNGPKPLTPVILAYVVGPLAFAALMVFRHYGLVSTLPVWIYALGVFVPVILAIFVESWSQAPSGSLRRHIRLGIHFLSVTLVIYISGWGPVLGMAYAFIVLEEVEQAGAATWRPAVCWSMASIGTAQVFLWYGWTPSFLGRSQAETIGALGAIVLVIIIRMAGATGESKERAEHELAYQALHDMLTGLPNRAYFYERANRALEESALTGNNCAVMLFDLDRFKEINDTLGHKYGDQVLVEIGPRVRSVLRANDTLARLGGDEFCVLLPDVHHMHDVAKVADRIIEALLAPFDVDGNNLAIEASCGISMAPSDGDSADLLLQRADIAMYAAKESVRNVVIYTHELVKVVPDRLALASDLRFAELQDELVLHYLPKASLASNHVLGAEALLRWQHPTLGLIGPSHVIPEAERTGMIDSITDWVLNASLRQCRSWLDGSDADGLPGLSVAVNLSAHGPVDGTLPDRVGDALARCNVPAGCLELEVTESMIMADPRRARDVLTELSEMGVVVAIDDFGTGFSSLVHLRDLPVRQLKIDRSFVRDMARDLDDSILVRSVIDLARNLGLQTVAEGVEDELTHRRLAEMGCDYAQGYFVAPPMPSRQFELWLAGHALAAVQNQPSGDPVELAAVPNRWEPVTTGGVKLEAQLADNWRHGPPLGLGRNGG